MLTLAIHRRVPFLYLYIHGTSEYTLSLESPVYGSIYWAVEMILRTVILVTFTVVAIEEHITITVVDTVVIALR